MVMGDINKNRYSSAVLRPFRSRSSAPVGQRCELLRGAAHQTLKETVQHLCCVVERY